MKSPRILTIAGTGVHLHPSFAILAAVLILPSIGEGTDEFIKRVFMTGVLLVSITLHEFGHVYMARRQGLWTGNIYLNMLGGLASVQIPPERPMAELKVAIAGPAVNFLIAASFLISYFTFRPTPGSALYDGHLMIIASNAILMLFNLVPIFPMDGGRVARSLLSMAFGADRGTRGAVYLGWALLLPLTAYAIYTVDLILATICLFILLAGAVEIRALRRGREGSTDGAASGVQAGN